LAAGAWFFLFSVIPVWFVVARLGTDRLTLGNFARSLFTYWVGCSFFSIFPSIIFSFSDDSSIRYKWWRIAALVLCTAIFTLPPLKKFPKILALLSVTFTIFFVQSVLIDTVSVKKFGYGSITLWLFFIGVIAMLELMNREPLRLIDSRWFMTFFVGLFVLGIFGRYFYPSIEADWGGGAPIPVTIYFTKDSVILPSKSARVSLIDETDAGLYVTSGTETKAIYIPRTEIAILYFSDDVSKSDLLKQSLSGFSEPRPTLPLDSIHKPTDSLHQPKPSN
jgi:hypothetical protein